MINVMSYLSALKHHFLDKNTLPHQKRIFNKNFLINLHINITIHELLGILHTCNLSIKIMTNTAID